MLLKGINTLEDRHNKREVCDAKSCLLLYTVWRDISRSGTSNLRQHRAEFVGESRENEQWACAQRVKELEEFNQEKQK